MDDPLCFFYGFVITLQKYLIPSLGSYDSECLLDYPEIFVESPEKQVRLGFTVKFNLYCYRKASCCVLKVTKDLRPSVFLSLMENTSASSLVWNSPASTLKIFSFLAVVMMTAA